MTKKIFTCRMCKTPKGLDAFDKAPRNNLGHEHRCKTCKADERQARMDANPELYKARAKARYEQDTDRFRNNQLKYEYGITLERKRTMYEEQKGLCGLCNKPLPKDFRKACVDHNHETDQPRSLLHRRCNTIVGYEETDPGILSRAIDYKKCWDRRKNA